MSFVEAEHIRSVYAKRLKDLPDQSFADCPYCLKLNKLPDDNRVFGYVGIVGKYLR